MTLKEAQEQLPELVDKIASHRDEPISIVVNGQEALLIIDPGHYKLLRGLWDNHWDAIQKIQKRNVDEDPDEIYRMVTEIVEEVRQQRHDDRTAASARLD